MLALADGVHLEAECPSTAPVDFTIKSSLMNSSGDQTLPPASSTQPLYITLLVSASACDVLVLAARKPGDSGTHA